MWYFEFLIDNYYKDLMCLRCYGQIWVESLPAPLPTLLDVAFILLMMPIETARRIWMYIHDLRFPQEAKQREIQKKQRLRDADKMLQQVMAGNLLVRCSTD